MYKLVIDLEMNGIRSKNVPKGEIIEIGAVVLNDNFDIIEKYNTYVRPYNIVISNSVKKLTGITEGVLNKAPSLEEALRNLINITPDLNNTTLYAWSESDTYAIETELNYKNIHIDEVSKLCKEYVDVQEVFINHVGLKDRINLTKALNMIGFKFNGREHGALADAINTSLILKEIETNDDINKTIEDIQSYMESEPLTSTIGDLFNNLKIDLQ